MKAICVVYQKKKSNWVVNLNFIILSGMWVCWREWKEREIGFFILFVSIIYIILMSYM